MIRVLIPVVAVALIALCLGAGEAKPAKSLPCFPGAVYRKAVSGVGDWTGVAGVVTLPAVTFDENRKNEKKPGQYLDNPSIYLGGRSVTNAGSTEIDCGLTWEVVREPDGTVSAERKAFRPFWRNAGWHSAPARPDLYFHPGDTVRLSCRTTAPGTLTIAVALLARAGDGTDPATLALDSPPLSTFEQTFDAPGFGPGARQEFKRVNAIDQVGNEGRPAQPTAARVEGATWQACALYRDGSAVPFTPDRYTDMRCPTPAAVVVAPHHADAGGESITLAPSGDAG